MRIEILLFLYSAVCVSMIGFNLMHALILRGSEPRMARRTRRMRDIICLQMDRLAQGDALEDSGANRLRKRLQNVNNLVAFDRALCSLDAAHAPRRDAYMTHLQPVLLQLARFYGTRESIQTAYFSFFLSRYMLRRHMSVQPLQEVLLGYMAKENLYCRVNALQALCAFGHPGNVAAAVEIQDRGEVFFHEKILTESLLSFAGDHRALISLLWARFPSFTPHTRLAIVNYIRFHSGDYPERMFALMQDPAEDKEVRLAAIRYFGRYRYPPALPALLAMAGETDPGRWEYVTVSVTVLAGYRGEQVTAALKQALHSANWHVRYAAAAGLEAQQMSYESLADLMMSGDRYAREMMMYRLETRRLRQERG